MIKIGKSKISDNLWIKIVDYYTLTYTGVIPHTYSMTDFSRHRLESALVQFERIRNLNVNPKLPSLDAGCGVGTFVTLMNLEGYNYYGYEIDPKVKEIAVEMLKINGLSPDRIQSSPDSNNFKNIKFDFISSFEVVEHVADLRDYLRKLRLVISKQGKLFIETPNYKIPYEPHYYLFFPPGPKNLKWWIFRLAGKSNKLFFDELRFITPRQVEGELTRAGFWVINLGIIEWTGQLSDNAPSYRSIYIQKFFQLLRITHLGILAQWLAALGFYTPLVYLASPKST